MSWFLLNRNLTLLEPYDWKLSCTVLRGERGSNAPDLPGKALAHTFGCETGAYIIEGARCQQSCQLFNLSRLPAPVKKFLDSYLCMVQKVPAPDIS